MTSKEGLPVGFQHGGSSRELEDESTGKSNEYSQDSGSQVNPPYTTKYSQYTMAVFAALLYGIVGLTMGFANKAVLQIWPFSNTLLVLQMATSVVLVYTMRFFGLIDLRPFEWKAAKQLSGVVFFYNANVAFALAAVRALSIPVYHVMKRLTPVMVLIAKSLSGEGPPPLQVTLSVMTVVAGCILAGLGDLSFDAMGYAMALSSCALQTTYLLMVERSGTEKGYNSNELLLYNALLSLPVLLLLVWATGESAVSIPAFFNNTTPYFTLLVCGSVFMGSLLNYSLFLCTITNSALSTTIVGTLRSVVGTILGFFLLGGVKVTPLIIIGVTTNTAGGVWYTMVKYRQKHISKKLTEAQRS